MRLLIDKKAAVKAVLLTSTDENGDRRRYYEAGTMLIVVRNDLDLIGLANRIVDAQVGWDTAMPGFTLDESLIGQQRTKVTIYRPIPQGQKYAKKLRDLID